MLAEGFAYPVPDALLELVSPPSPWAPGEAPARTALTPWLCPFLPGQPGPGLERVSPGASGLPKEPGCAWE